MPPLEGVISEMTLKVDKATLDVIRIQMTGDYLGNPFVAAIRSSQEYLGGEAYPLEVGKEWMLVETDVTRTVVLGETNEETEQTRTTVRVEGVEQVTVPAGTFRSFRIVSYDDTGTAIVTAWVSDKTRGHDVKQVVHGTGEVTELVSYSLVAQSPGGGAAEAKVVNITLTENPYTFQPDDIDFEVGTTYVLTFNAPNELHTFTVDDLDLDVNINAGDPVKFEFTPTQAGTFELICIPHEALGMVGELTVS